MGYGDGLTGNLCFTTEQSDAHKYITKKDGKLGFFNYKFCVPPVYDEIIFGRGLAFVRFKKDGRFGLLTKTSTGLRILTKQGYLPRIQCLFIID